MNFSPNVRVMPHCDEGPQMFLSIHPGRNVVNNKQTTDSIETLGQVNMSWSEQGFLLPKVVFLCAKWPILSSILLVIVELLLSRVLSYIIDSASRSSTLSNPLVGLLILVDLVLILLSLDRCLRWNILFSYMNPFSIAARRTGGKVLRSLLGIRIQVIRSFLTVKGKDCVHYDESKFIAFFCTTVGEEDCL